MTNNILPGVETKLRKLVEAFNIATRDGTPRGMADALAKIQETAREAESQCNTVIFGGPEA